MELVARPAKIPAMNDEWTADNEIERIRVLQGYQILDTPAEGFFDAITALAAVLLKVPAALVSLVDTNRIWFKSRVGIELEQVDRCPGLRASVILREGPYMIRDTATDPRTASHPLNPGGGNLQTGPNRPRPGGGQSGCGDRVSEDPRPAWIR